jgi:long-chain acyl-CoA synthetase
MAFSHRPKLRQKSWTNGEISKAANQFARELETRQIGHGDRVIIWAENSPEWVAAFFGIVLRGAIAVPLDEQSAPDFVQRVCDKTEPKLRLLGRDVDGSSLGIPIIELADLPKTIERHPTKPIASTFAGSNDTVEIVFTSGTTAEPKGVVLTHENLMANLAPMEREINKYIHWKFLVDPIKILCLLPLSHVFGQMMGIFLPRMLEAEVIFQNRLNPSEIIDTIKRERVMVTAAVPRILETLEHKIKRDYESGGRLDELDESVNKERSWLGAWWKYRRVHRMLGFKFVSFVTGGATLDEQTENFWRRLGYAVVQGYGMTETAALVSLNNPFSSRRGSLGQILAGRENIRINENGEILVRGKNISPGYWGEKDRVDGNEWLNTGDIGSLDETGRLYFKGRKKDVIVTAAGLNIYPEDLETALNSQPETISTAVVSVDGANGPEPAAALILRPDSNAADVVALANKRLAPYQQIHRWIEWPDADFPRTPTQKIRKNMIVEEISKQAGKKSEPTASGLTKIIARLGNAAGTRSDRHLSDDLAMDSLSRVELMSAIEDEYQIDLDERVFTETTTIAELEQLIRTRGEQTDDSPRFSFPRWPLKIPISWIRPMFYELVIWPITRILCWANVRGRDNLSKISGPVLFASNHVTYVDPALVMAAMPRRFRRRLAIAMDGERLRAYLHPPVGTGPIKRIRWFFTYWLVVTFFNAFPLPKLSGFRKSFDFAGEAMDRGYNVLIFPEGELTKDGSIQPFKSGIGLLTDGLEVPVVPVAITGLYELRAAGQRGWAPPGSVTITFGVPLKFDQETEPKKVANELESEIQEMCTPRD